MSHSRKRVCILGSTGSIGEKTLQIIRDHPDLFEAAGLSAHTSGERLAAQIAEFRPAAACLSGEGKLPETNGAARRFFGAEGILRLIEECKPDIVVSALVGAAGLVPTLRAIELGMTVALANKEVLVTAGKFTMDLARARGVKILPIDSEHNAIFQCLNGNAAAALRRIILTASGGPFRGWTRERLETATLAQALKHPTWEMGRKITIDSATMMNKGFEVIEGHHLFGVDVEKIEVVVHPQSVIHSMVEFVDGSMFAQMGVTDMYFPIVNALSHPERLPNARFKPLALAAIGSLAFEEYDRAAFPCPGFAYEAARRGGTYPAALNAANEVAVERFLAGEIKFLEIPEIIDAVLQAHKSVAEPTIEAIREADALARRQAGRTQGRAANLA
ncbi:1-deoxy-D-xylulose-5-phosphate reductoisomerase [Candidatus Sumerlaeota bacterium]|nr:1-deoxy-D-xylulose-5-phosphate reductoisomerase [Candidatus Sumerlaeota bacterium]MBI3735356.1 1-deoxy-D-xylulose-5-phosphate reductoisomerase [Candidatus Sumerlaeota bacterium]